jgi:TRAP-type C4-dicarboxylate transport system permease small subunit
MQRARLSIGEWILALLFGAAIVIIGAQVVFRYVLNSSLSWPEEIARYLFTWMIFLGAALALRDKTHIAVTLVRDKLPAAFQRRARLVTHGIILAFLMLLFVLGLMLVHHTRGTQSEVLSLPVNLVYYAALPATVLLGIYYAAANILALLRDNAGISQPEER